MKTKPQYQIHYNPTKTQVFPDSMTLGIPSKSPLGFRMTTLLEKGGTISVQVESSSHLIMYSFIPLNRNFLQGLLSSYY